MRVQPLPETALTSRGPVTFVRRRAAVLLPLREHVAVRMLPIAFFQMYLAATVLLFAFGPWPYPVQNGIKLYTFLGLAHVALLIGYVRGIRRPARPYGGRFAISRLALVSLVVTAVLFVPTVWFRTGSLLPNVAAGLSDAGAAFSDSSLLRQTQLPLIEYVRFIVAVPLSLLLPLTAFYWTRMGRALRMGCAICLISIPALFVAMGTNKAIADIVLILPWLLLASYVAGNIRAGFTRVTAALAITGCLFALFVTFFALTQMSRSGSASRFGYFRHIRARADYNNVLLRGFSPEVQTGVLGLTTYLSQGYYALYLSLDRPTTFSYGVGHSMFLFRQAARLPGMDWIEETPYPVQIEEDGWSAYGLFSSIYPWLASDLTFPGTLLIIGVIGQCLAVTWKETLVGDNPFAVAMFVQFLIMIYYFPANNQCLQSGESFAAFWGTCIMWLATRSHPKWTARTVVARR
jgi:hypothetical protein